MKKSFWRNSLCILLLLGPHALAGPKGTIRVPRVTTPIRVDGSFDDWPLANYTTVAQQPVFPNGQGVGVPTNANGDHLVWDVNRVGPFNGTDLGIYSPETKTDFGSSVYLAYDDKFLYMLGVFIDEDTNGERGDNGLSNFLNDGFEIFVDAKGDSDDLIAELGFPNVDQESPNTDDFQFTMGLNDFFPPNPKGSNDLGVEVHVERAGDPGIVGAEYLAIRDSTNFTSVGGRDVAAKSYTDLRAAGARNPEIAANPNVTFPGYAVELVIPFGITEGFQPGHDMGFDLFWRDVDNLEEPDPGFGGSGIFWTDWAQATTVSGSEEDGNLFHAGNWGKLQFVSGGKPNDFNGDGNLNVSDIDLLMQAIRTNSSDAKFDVDKNGTVGGDDLVAYVEGPSTLKTYIGDANLDGVFNSADFVTVFAAGQYEDAAAANSTWGTGDWNADGEFSSADLVSAFQRGGYEQGPRAAVSAVPEPSTAAIGVVVAAWISRRRRR